MRQIIWRFSTHFAPPGLDIALSSDFIVGHPGETDEDFEATLALVEEVGCQAYSFKYSPVPARRPLMEDVVPEVKSERLAWLQAC